MMRGESALKYYILAVCLLFHCQGQNHDNTEYSPQDGWFNNLLHPDWGAIDGQLLRFSPTTYKDGVYEPSGDDRPNPIEISDQIHSGETGRGSCRKRTAMLVFFGQQVVEEILDAQRPGCPPEYFNIPIPKGHPMYDSEGKGDKEMPFLRTRYDQRTGYSPNNPRQQLNEITPYIDGGLFYGASKAWTDTLREFKGGMLKAQDPNKPIKASLPVINDIALPMANPPPPRDHYLKPVKRFYRLGNPRGNENPFMLSFAVLFFRWHNWIARDLQLKHQSWDDERLFNEARKLVIAYHQNIVLYQWLPRFLSISYDNTNNCHPRNFNNPPKFQEIPAYKGYNPSIHPGIAQEFQTAAMRFGHTLVPPAVWIRSKVENGKCTYFKTSLKTKFENRHALRLCNTFWNSQEAVEDNIEGLFLGMASQICEQEDNIIVPDLRGNVFGPLEFSRRDLIALNIQRARDHGLPDYNTIRKAYGLNETIWSTINPSHNLFEIKNLIKKLKRLYGGRDKPDNLDLFTGGLLETIPNGPGELFRKIILQQYLRIRDGDRFWFENTENGLFTPEEIKEIKNVTLYDIILKTTTIRKVDIQEDVFILGDNNPCPQLFQLSVGNDSIIENCTKIQYYDYFSGSEISYALSFTALGLCVPGAFLILFLLSKHRRKKMAISRQKTRVKKMNSNMTEAIEWVGNISKTRHIQIYFIKPRKKMKVTDTKGKTLRYIDLRQQTKVNIRLATDKLQETMSVRIQGEVDLVLIFPSFSERQDFLKKLQDILGEWGINHEVHGFPEKVLYSSASTKDDRQKVLDKFFRVICLQAFKLDKTSRDLQELNAETYKEIVTCELTRTEFSDALGMQATSIFVRNMFHLLDKENKGTLSFREFLDCFVILASGDSEKKARLMFDMYDVRRNGFLARYEFSQMIRSLLELADASLETQRLEELVNTMFKHLKKQKTDSVTFEDFKTIFISNEYGDVLQKATLGLEGSGVEQNVPAQTSKSFASRRQTCFHHDLRKKEGSALTRSKSRIRVSTIVKKYPKTKTQQQLYTFSRYVENYRLQIFWLSLYILITAGIFIERAYVYSIEREHGGLRQIAGYGVTITRGAASVMMFTYSSLLVTMSRNTITFFRETFLHIYIPFDSSHAMHKFVAILALIFTILHCIGHAINFYHISTQTASDVICLFREFFRSTHVLPTFHYWCFGTITGLTGVLATLVVIIMYVFAIQYSRRNVFQAFWFTHNLYVVLYILMLLHGCGRLVQDPIFFYFFVGPMVLFLVDKLITFSRNKIEITVFKADLLPSGVTCLVFKRPLNFEYQSGQWVRVACLELGENEYHPFTLTSAPHEDTLSLHIRAVGPWTTNLRRVYDTNTIYEKSYSKLYLDGPFGEGHQDWYRFPVSVLVGGGIGVTPFASILKDIVHRSRTGIRYPCKKVYFLWVTRTQRHFEWMTDIIREVEDADTNELVSVHIFITQFFQKFDLRTTMLYICERHFQKIANRSLFTGLKSITHFGRPQFSDFLFSLQSEHHANRFGVFSCGPPPMTNSVQKACTDLNKREGATYIHHFENF